MKKAGLAKCARLNEYTSVPYVLSGTVSPMKQKPPTPNLTVITGSKATYEISLVKQIINRQLTGREFVEKVEARGQLTIVDGESVAKKQKDK